MKDRDRLMGIIGVLAAVAFAGCASAPRLTTEQQATQIAWEAENPRYASASHFAWRQVEGGVRITRYTGPGGDVRIPPQINGLPVIEITGRAHIIGDTVPFHAGAFEGSGITGVTIPDGVTTIGGGAFARNRIAAIDIPDSVIDIGRNAFAFNPLTGNVIVPAGATIGANAFMRNRNVHGEPVQATATRITPEQRQLIAEDPDELRRIQTAQSRALAGADTPERGIYGTWRLFVEPVDDISISIWFSRNGSWLIGELQWVGDEFVMQGAVEGTFTAVAHDMHFYQVTMHVSGISRTAFGRGEDGLLATLDISGAKVAMIDEFTLTNGRQPSPDELARIDAELDWTFESISWMPFRVDDTLTDGAFNVFSRWNNIVRMVDGPAIFFRIEIGLD